MNRIVPLDSFRTGNISYCTNPGCTAMNSKTPAQVKAMDPAGQGELATWLNLVNNAD